jgi:hypothetical protein
MKPVTRTRGKRSAVATPTLAVWAARRRSAAWTSGRRRSRSAASPIGRAAISGVTSASWRPGRVQLARPLADQDAQPVVGALLGRDQGRDDRLGGVEAGLGAGDVDRVAGPGVVADLGQPQGLALGVEVAVGHGQAGLGAAQFEVVAGHLGGDGHLGVAQVGSRRPRLGPGRLHAPADAAEQVDLPAGVEAGLVGLALDPLAVRARLLLVALLVGRRWR